MKNLVIHDVFPYLYKGMAKNSTSYNNFRVKRFPVGGIKYLLRQLIFDLPKGSDVAFCFDSGRSIRKQKLGTYKSGRPFSPEIVAQAEALYKYFEATGLPVFKEIGYEADDLIYSACVSAKKSGQYHKVIVCGNDYDLTHNVDKRCDFRSISTNTNSCDWMDFPTAVVGGKYLPLNTISAYKTIFGDTSDTYKAVSLSSMSSQALFDLFVKVLERRSTNGELDVAASRSKELIVTFISSLENKGLLTNDEGEHLRLNAELVYPMYVEKDYTFESLSNLDSYKQLSLAKLAVMCGEKDLARLIGAGKAVVDEEDKDFFAQQSKYLESGEVMADSGFPMSLSKSFTNVTDLRGV